MVYYGSYEFYEFFGTLFWILFGFSSMLISYGALALSLIGSWFTFKKMGKPGWKGLIPFYNLYVLFDELWETKYFRRMMIFLGIYVGSLTLGILMIVFGVLFTAIQYPSGAGGVILLITGVLVTLASVVMLILSLMIEYQLYSRMARAFNLARGWAWGLLFVSFIMLPFIGFDKSIVYYGQWTQQ